MELKPDQGRGRDGFRRELDRRQQPGLHLESTTADINEKIIRRFFEPGYSAAPAAAPYHTGWFCGSCGVAGFRRSELRELRSSPKFSDPAALTFCGATRL